MSCIPRLGTSQCLVRWEGETWPQPGYWVLSDSGQLVCLNSTESSDVVRCGRGVLCGWKTSSHTSWQCTRGERRRSSLNWIITVLNIFEVKKHFKVTWSQWTSKTPGDPITITISVTGDWRPVCLPYHLPATAPVRLLIMSDLDSLLVELESSIERRVTSSSTTTCTRVTVETGCEDTSSITRQQPRSDSQHEWPAQSASQPGPPPLTMGVFYYTAILHSIILSHCKHITYHAALQHRLCCRHVACRVLVVKISRHWAEQKVLLWNISTMGAEWLLWLQCYLTQVAISLSLSLSPLCWD